MSGNELWPSSEPSPLPAVSRSLAPARARTCYDHLAGALGLAIIDAMTDRGLLDWEQGLTLTGEGTAWPGELGITVPPARRRPPVRSCLDWTGNAGRIWPGP